MSTARRALGYIPALDGLRALAVAAVIAYHLGYSQVPGGYIGVEVFFVLSGWLVCALIDDERRTQGRVDLKAFWLRRARRLLPAVTLTIASVLIVATLVNYDRFLSLRGDALAAMAYILNWRLIFQNQSYFAAAAGPSPLQHLWSLSIEEQFYLVLPLLLAFVVSKPRLAANAVTVVLGLAVVSTVWRFVLDTPGADPSRLYYGTDTRAAGLLLGATLGLVWVPSRLRRVPGAWAGILLDVAALAGLLVIAWYTFKVDEHDPGAFAGSLTAVQIATLVLIAAVVHPFQGVVATALSAPPLRWVGQRSYGIYLWHWPIIILFARAPGEQPEAPATSVALVALTLLIAGASYHWFEQPIRQRGLARAFGDLKVWLPGKMLARPAVGGVILGVSVLVCMAGVATAHHMVTAPADHMPTEEMAGMDGSEAELTPPTVVEPAASGSPQNLLPAPTPSRPGAATGPAAAAASSGAPATAVPPRPMPPITGIGDSVMLGAKPSLANRIGPTIDVEAKVGRQMVDSPEFVEELAEHGQLGDIVIMHLGANGPFPDSTIDDVIDIIGHRKLLLLNVKVPRRWEGEVNDRLYAAAERHHEIQMVDWRAVADAEPGLLTRDGYHLTPRGAKRYTDVVADAITEALRPNNPGHGNGHYPA